ncbi:MAG TPA: SAM-dependent methyltransferase [Porticoccaceae bacterium]|nr:SAM-dependent methyltransferase [Porticoccaceae bacterium]
MAVTESELVLLACPEWRYPAQALAKRLVIACLQTPSDIFPPRYLLYDNAGLALIEHRTIGRKGAVSSSRIRCDFVSGAARHRRRYGGGTGQALARAVGLSSGFKPLVADLTAGLGRDGFVLASLGARVIWLERHPIVAALLADGLDRLRTAAAFDRQSRDGGDQHEHVLAEIVARLSFYEQDGRAWLEDGCRRDTPDVIYLDPMFPGRDKSAAVKKEMAAFQELVGGDDDAGKLLDAALKVARYRVVVKRPRGALFLAERKPTFTLEGKTTRFDVYSLAKIPR